MTTSPSDLPDEPKRLHSPDLMDAVHASELQAPDPTDLSQWRPLCGITTDRIRIPDSLAGQFAPIVTTNGLTDVTCVDCRALLEEDEPVPAGLAALVATTRSYDGIRPIDRITISNERGQREILGDDFEMGSLRHDVNTGTVTLTFCDVRALEVIYKDKLHGRTQP